LPQRNIARLKTNSLTLMGLRAKTLPQRNIAKVKTYTLTVRLTIDSSALY